MKIACWMIVLVAALGLGSVAKADQASTPDAFYGRFQGTGFTHDPNAAAHADTVVLLADGQIVEEIDNPSSELVAERMTHLGD